MSKRNSVTEFVLPLVPRFGMRLLAAHIWTAAADDPRLAAKLNKLGGLLEEKAGLLAKEHRALHDRFKSRAGTLNIPTVPEPLRPLVAVAYIRARGYLATGQAHGILDNLPSMIDNANRFVAATDHEVVGSLLQETLLAMRDDKEFAKTLNTAAEELNTLVGYDAESGPGSPTASSGSAKPKCYIQWRDASGKLHRIRVPCWLVTAIIVLVIILLFKNVV